MISPQLQQAITSPEGLMIAGMTATSIAALYVLIAVATGLMDRRRAARNERRFIEEQRRYTFEPIFKNIDAIKPSDGGA